MPDSSNKQEINYFGVREGGKVCAFLVGMLVRRAP
jgi:hypothetical protein